MVKNKYIRVGTTIYKEVNKPLLSKRDETMFLGAGKYAELDMLDFDPQRKELVVLTKGNDRTLIRFNYITYLHTHLAHKVLETYFSKEHDFLSSNSSYLVVF